ncbi:MAG: AAA domain-containing protein [Bacilli bacterium]|nr:AAA domain-containing protein [Bacilli bacterium]
MREFKELFESLGYIFPSADVLEDTYLFYKYYSSSVNKGVASILLEGDPGCGKTFLSEVFAEFLRVREDTEFIYTQCVEETNSDRLIATYNVPAIVKGDADKSIAAGILTKAICLANQGKKVVLAVDELDKAREALDAYFLDFLQSGKIETADNKILALTAEGRKNIYAIFAKNSERNLLDALLRRCSVIQLPPMPPVLAYKTLLMKFENVEHDPKFLKFICKVYEAIYNEQMNNNCELLSRLPSLQELITAITGDYELYQNGISSTRRINSLIRKLGKEAESRKIITNILTKKFKYQNQESNYTNETLDLDMTDPEDYMSTKDPNSLVEQYIEKKDNGEYIFEEDEAEDPMKDIASILDNMKEDQSLIFIEKENKEKIVELGVLTHPDPNALNVLFHKIQFKGNPNSRFGFLNFEGDNFIGLMRYKDTLILISNKEYVSPRLLMRGLSTIITIIYDAKENIDWDKMYFSPFSAKEFKLTGLNVKILSNIPKVALQKMNMKNGIHVYQSTNLKVTYDDSLNISYFRYLQKYTAEPLFAAIERICEFNPELALPISFVNAKKFDSNTHHSLLKKHSRLEEAKRRFWEPLIEEGWDVQIDEFTPMDLKIIKLEKSRNHWSDEPEITTKKDTFVFEWNEERDSDKKTLHVYPKYKLKNGYLLYTADKDFENDEYIMQLNPLQKEIAFMVRSIFGNYVPISYKDQANEYFSSLTMSQMGRIVDNEQNRIRIPGINNDILTEPDFVNYYNTIAEAAAVMTANKVLKKGVITDESNS